MCPHSYKDDTCRLFKTIKITHLQKFVQNYCIYKMAQEWIEQSMHMHASFTSSTEEHSILHKWKKYQFQQAVFIEHQVHKRLRQNGQILPKSMCIVKAETGFKAIQVKRSDRAEK